MKSRIETANAPGCDFPLQNLPYGVFSVNGDAPRCGVAIGDQILDLAAAEAAGLIDAQGTFAAPQLNDFMALGRDAWAATRARLTELLSEGATEALPLVPMAEAGARLGRLPSLPGRAPLDALLAAVADQPLERIAS